MIRQLLDLVYPSGCVGCARSCPSGDQPLCSRCTSELERADPAELHAHIVSLIPTFAVDEVFAVWLYDKGGMLQRAHHALKYGGRPLHGLRLGSIMALGWQRAGRRHDAIVVPVPLHRARLYERGYNQAAMLAKGFSETARLPVREDLLTRIAATHRQTGLSRERRISNLAGAFRASSYVSGASILLVDDVVTTGATLHAGAEALIAAGAVRVTCAALGYART